MVTVINKTLRMITLFWLVQAAPAPAAEDIMQTGVSVLKSAVKNKDAFIEINEPREIELGGGMSAQLLGAAGLVENPDLQKYVNRIGMWLVFQTERTALPWRFAVLDEDSINAFAAPGGYIFISRGLFMLFRSESELAGVLAHEIGHVLARHHLEDIQEKARNRFMKDVGGMVIDDVAGGQWKQLVKQLVNSGVDVWESGLNREDEFQADELGVVIAARAGYDPYGLMGVLDTLGRLDHGQGNLYEQMHATHPPASERLQRLDTRMTGTMEAYAVTPAASSTLYEFQQQLENEGGL